MMYISVHEEEEGSEDIQYGLYTTVSVCAVHQRVCVCVCVSTGLVGV